MDQDRDSLPPVDRAALLVLCAAKLLLHLLTSVRNYGYFRDELYYMDMARHLDWGYVDSAPLIAVYTKAAMLLGGSLAALRILPALAGAALVALTMFIARELGGGRYAQFLAGLAILIAPAFLLIDSLLTMNAFEPLYWMGAVLVLIRIIRTGNSRHWLLFGLLTGLGLENKHSTVSFGFAVFVALILSPQRRELRKPWVWLGGAIVVLLFLPNLIWQIQHHFPTIEDLQNVKREGKNVVLPPLTFVKQQILDLHPLLFPVWLSGLIWFLRDRTWRILGFLFAAYFALMVVAHAKDYYVFPIYPLLFAGGAAAIESWASKRWLRVAISAVLIAGAIPTTPLATWMLAPDSYLRYARALGFVPQKAEVHHAGLLPQPMGDQFGWPELVRDVAEIYNALPPAERAKTGIFAGNYGEAGAVNLFGTAYGLPRAYSRHQNHWYWGPPDSEYTNLIVLQWSEDDVKDNCTSYQAFPHEHPDGMAEENTPIYLCRGAKFDLRKIWWHSHHWN